MNRTLYAHWLDPEYLTWRAESVFYMQRRQEKIETLLKMHAVLGDCVVLSDVQLTDSRSILLLFNDVHFRRFLEAFPDFFFLRSRPATRFDKVQSTKLAAILSGLDRALGDDWVSSTFRDVGTVKGVAKTFKSSSYEQDAANICKARLRDEKDPLFIGLLYGVHHFCVFPEHVTPCSDSGSSYDKVLEHAETLLPREGIRAEKVQATLRYVGDHGKPGQLFKRAPVILALHNAGLESAAHRAVYLNIIQAWNVGVSNTLHADRDEAPAFDIVDPLPLLFGQFREAALETNMTLGDHEFLEQIYSSPWHPAQLSWDLIRRIRSNEKCRTAISQYQDKIISNEEVGQEFQILTKAIGTALAEERFSGLENAAQITALGRDIGDQISRFGKAVLPVLPPVGFLCLAGAEVVKFSDDTLKSALHMLRSKSRSEIAQGLKDYAIRYRLHRWTDEGEVQ